MIVALDATALILLLDREAAGPVDQTTGQRITAARERLAYLATRVSKEKGGRLVIPTPAYGEAAVRIDPAVAMQQLALIERLRSVRLADFDKRAALEFARMQRDVINEVPRRQRRAELDTRSKAKFDQQIVAIALVERAAFLVSDDRGLGAYAKRFGLSVRRVGDLELPPSEAQGSLPLDPPEDVVQPDDGDD